MPEQFSVKEDIAPLSSRFFQGLSQSKGLDALTRRELSENFFNDSIELEKVRLDLASRRQNLELGDLRKEEGQLRLGQLRLQVQREQSAAEQAGDLSTKFRGILDNKLLSPTEKVQEIDRLPIDLPDVFTNSPQARLQYETARKAADPVSTSERRLRESQLRADLAELRRDRDYRDRQDKDRVTEARALWEAKHKAVGKDFSTLAGLRLEDADTIMPGEDRGFRDPKDKQLALGLIETYAPDMLDDVSGASASEILEAATAAVSRARQESNDSFPKFSGPAAAPVPAPTASGTPAPNFVPPSKLF